MARTASTYVDTHYFLLRGDVSASPTGSLEIALLHPVTPEDRSPADATLRIRSERCAEHGKEHWT